MLMNCYQMSFAMTGFVSLAAPKMLVMAAVKNGQHIGLLY